MFFWVPESHLEMTKGISVEHNILATVKVRNLLLKAEDFVSATRAIYKGTITSTQKPFRSFLPPFSGASHKNLG